MRIFYRFESSGGIAAVVEGSVSVCRPLRRSRLASLVGTAEAAVSTWVAALPRKSRFLRSAVAFAPAPVGMTNMVEGD
jgi:hypothetical protein